MIQIKNNKILYRVEHCIEKSSRGHGFAGPYFGGVVEVEDWCDANSNYHSCLKKYPEIYSDPDLIKKFPMDSHLFVCGFDSLDKLRKWFSKTELCILKEFGFGIFSYESNEFVIGKKQSIFKIKSERIYIEEMKIYEK